MGADTLRVSVAGSLQAAWYLIPWAFGLSGLLIP
jgi:hypothetical protein